MSGYKKRSLPAKYEDGVLLKLDGRTKIYKRLNAAYKEVIDDLGGEDGLSFIQRSLVERYCFLQSLIAAWEAEIMENPLSDRASELVGRATQAPNAASGIAKQLGLKRVTASGPSLKTYMGAKRGPKPKTDAESEWRRRNPTTCPRPNGGAWTGSKEPNKKNVTSTTQT